MQFNHAGRQAGTLPTPVAPDKPWRLGIKHAPAGKGLVVMPADAMAGVLTEAEIGGLECVVTWPVNPYFTGRDAIVEMLNQYVVSGELKGFDRGFI